MVERTYIRSGAVQGALNGMRALGLQTDPLKDMRLSPDLLTTPETLVDTDTYVELIDRGSHASGDGEHLLRVGLELELADFGLAGQSLLVSDTMAEAISQLQTLVKYFQSRSSFEVTTHRNRTQICYMNWCDDDPDTRLDVQYTVGVVASIILLPDYPFDPEIRLYYPDAKAGSLQSGHLDYKTVSSSIGIVEFDSRVLQAAMPGRQLEHSEILKRFFADIATEELFTMNLASASKRLMSCGFDVAPLCETSLANLLDLHPRTLRRRLKAEGTSYTHVLREARQSAATRDLASGRSVTETALKLGYEHPQNFTTAFQTWFGVTPSAARGRCRIVEAPSPG